MNLVHAAWRFIPKELRRNLLFGAINLATPRISGAEPEASTHLYMAGLFSAANGLGQASRRVAEALRVAGCRPNLSDITSTLKQGVGPAPSKIPDGEGTILVHAYGPLLPPALLHIGRRAVSKKKITAIWDWELDILPRRWAAAANFAHEIWVASSFTASCFPKDVNTKVRVMPYPVPRLTPSMLDRQAFGLPENAFVSLTIFDAASSLDRKNPMATILAHQMAFGNDPNKILVLKVSGLKALKGEWSAIKSAIGNAENIRVLEQRLPRDDLSALVACSDALVSLHRSEGFGFSIAEAMTMGKPVIATGWSGNMDFMRGPGAFPVPFSMVPASDRQGTYDVPRATWADPNIPEAAAIMATVAACYRGATFPEREFPAPDYRAALKFKHNQDCQI